MSDAPDPANGEPPAAAHDPRLDASGDDHPAVQPSKFDLIALEQTRYGLQFLGLGLALWAVAHPFIDHQIFGLARYAGWFAYALGLLTMAVAVWICAPTPHGPLPRAVKGCFLLGSAAGIVIAIVHLNSQFAGTVPEEGIRKLVYGADNSSRAMCVGLLWILWRFCQHRGLTGRGIVWLWIAMAVTALELPEAIKEWRSWWVVEPSWSWLSVVSWGFVPLAILAIISAQQTARDVWLDAVYRHSKFFVVTNPKADVVPLHSAERH
ncbi:MAG: hypothetical protein ABIP42_18400 [Planctomycetota bacterium]